MGENERRSYKSANHHASSNRITAEAARELSNSSLKQLTRIYKEIRYVAEDGTVKLEWGICSPSQVALDKIVETLGADGFTVEVTGEKYKTLIITW